MTALPIADWQFMQETESALWNTLAALDRYQAGWEQLLATQAAPATEQPSVDQLNRDRGSGTPAHRRRGTGGLVERELHDWAKPPGPLAGIPDRAAAA